MTKRDLLGTKLDIYSEYGKAFNLDTILLSDFTRIPKGTKLIMDFGTGNAAVMLYLSQKYEGELLGVEIQESRYQKAIYNINMNQLDARVHVVLEDLNVFKHHKLADIIVSNPPFFKVNDKTKQSDDLDMQIAKHELYLNLESLILAVRRNIKHGGLFFMIHKADRLEDIMKHLNENDFTIKRMRFVHPSLSHEPNQVLIEARYKGSYHLTVMPPLIQYQKPNQYSDEMLSIYQGRSYKK